MIDAIRDSWLLSFALWAAVVALCGCDTPQQRPAPSVTQSQRQSEPQDEEQAPQEPAPKDPAAQQAEPEYLPPSDNAADVEVTEIPTTPQATSASHEQDQQSAPVESDPGRVGPVINIGGAQTDEERAAALENKLDSELSEFDGMMRDRRTALEQAERAAGGGAPSGVAGGRGFRTEGREEERGAGGRASVGSGQGNTPDLAGEERQGDIDHVAIGPVPDDIPSERDDDIVARQLREAAMKETDPVLREKLWDEYRKYRKGLKSR